jgi:glycosyltransferase involved in cell wall biosynthesis
VDTPPPGPRPRLSVLLPCHDAAPTLPDAIASLRAQTLENFEVIAVDDRSSDATADLLADWAARDPRVTVLTRAQQIIVHSGLVPALNQAAAVARAPLLARMDADDVAHPERFERQASYLAAHPGLAGCGAHVELFSPGQIRSGYRRYERWINGIETPEDVRKNAIVECPIAHPTLVIKKTVFDALGGYRDMGWPEDHDLVLRVLAAGARLANLPGNPLLRWRIREDRLSLTSPAYEPAAFRRCRVHFLRAVFLDPIRDVVVWGAGRVGKPLARELIRQGTPVAAFVDLDARKIGQEIHGAPVLSPDEFAERAEAQTGPPKAASSPRPYVLVAVGSPGVRDEIREALEARGFHELDDFRFCA